MLRELLEWLVTPAGLAARRHGLVGESVALAARCRRCRTAWEPHLRRCRRAMREAARACPEKGTVVVCGSGHLFDVPLAALAGMFSRVVLADAVHPLRARMAARGFGNVRLAATDLTGLLDAALGWRPGIDLDRIKPVTPTELAARKPDLTISANVLSQLALPVKARLTKLGCPEADILKVCRRIVQAHLDWLMGLPGSRCLITDTMSRDVDGETILDETDLLYGVTCPPGDASWVWELAPRPEAGRHFDQGREVRVVMRGDPKRTHLSEVKNEDAGGGGGLRPCATGNMGNT
ncbi:hypothetical protein [Desulfolutivibrio sulfoxidireducens]|uniref:hypothetical protein n=1 Tax=Desulfolutivibrio sulfoxidireducens TaxID=2773299 RepID=UPI00159E4CA8|nr:hypothetical protein [Desulfolutivibrio sulfoxidireducens]QLA16569.1 hypothetical protein GD605_10810 [Desulfolutivibrio sulfoxidireducens]QLA19549.1 hypothetical protein GD604_07245 [Desulfolutivibrio sulfoxidireducens]